MRAPDVNLTPAELQAIEVHKYFLSIQRGGEVSIEDAIEDFLWRYAEQWRRHKAQGDNVEQRSEIEKHRYHRSCELGRDVGSCAAALEWCERYADQWRSHRESLERNGFSRRSIVVTNPRCAHLRAWSDVTRTAGAFDCDVYVHQRAMRRWNFTLERKAFVNVKSLTGVLSLGITYGHPLEFIALGAQADAALDALQRLLEADPSGPPMGGAGLAVAHPIPLPSRTT